MAAEDIVYIVQARMGSTRLPGKVLAELGGRPMLTFMLERLGPLGLDHLVVATSALERDDPVESAARAAGADVVRGSEHDVLDRFVAVLDRYPVKTVVRLTGDCPLSDPELVHKVLSRHLDEGADYTSNVLPRSFPRGLDVEVIEAHALRAAASEALDPTEREHVTPFVYRRPERFRLANATSGRAMGDERWTVDTAEDLAVVRNAVTRMGDVSFSWLDLLDTLGSSFQPPAHEVWLRSADASDERFFLALRNDADSVRFSRDAESVLASAHSPWFRSARSDPAQRLWVGLLDGERIGLVRSMVTTGTALISIIMAPEHRGKGLSTGLLRAHQVRTLEDQQITTVRAEVHTGNAASLRAFTNAGYMVSVTSDPWVELRWERPR